MVELNQESRKLNRKGKVDSRADCGSSAWKIVVYCEDFLV